MKILDEILAALSAGDMDKFNELQARLNETEKLTLTAERIGFAVEAITDLMQIEAAKEKPNLILCSAFKTTADMLIKRQRRTILTSAAMLKKQGV